MCGGPLPGRRPALVGEKEAPAPASLFWRTGVGDASVPARAPVTVLPAAAIGGIFLDGMRGFNCFSDDVNDLGDFGDMGVLVAEGLCVRGCSK